MLNVVYGSAADTNPHDVAEFYDRLGHNIDAETQQIGRMIDRSVSFVSAKVDGVLVGIARGVCDGIRGYFTECKLDPAYQGPGAVTRRDGRIEHDAYGIATEMARRVMDDLLQAGARRVDVLAFGTEVDFLEEQGFRKSPGLVGLSLRPEDWLTRQSQSRAVAVS